MNWSAELEELAIYVPRGITPFDRTFIVTLEARMFVVQELPLRIFEVSPENREFAVAADVRIFDVPHENRELMVATDQRVFTVGKEIRMFIA